MILGLSFSKSIKIFKDISLNFSTSGISISGGIKGAKLNQKIVGKNSGRLTFSAGKYGIKDRKTIKK
jgi:hypothetical protein